jgi:hypothetical protein
MMQVQVHLQTAAQEIPGMDLGMVANGVFRRNVHFSGTA